MDDASTGSLIRANSIHTNGGLGADHSSDGPTANDPSNVETGPNELQSHPDLQLIMTVALAATSLTSGLANSKQ